MKRRPIRNAPLLCILLLPLAALPALAATPAPSTGDRPATTASRAPATAAPALQAPPFPVPVSRRNGILVEPGGRGLYTYDPDPPGRSLCNAQCATLWPPLEADAAAVPVGEFSIVVRTDGRRQWAWKGKPLYRWLSDRKRGDAKGDGVADAWRLVKPPTYPGDPIPAFVPMRR